MITVLNDIVSIGSVNPDIEKGRGEIDVGNYIAEYCEKAGLEVETQDVADGRFNVIATLKGAQSGKTLMLNGHMDTVGVRNMSIDPFKPFIEDNRLHGRGASDMKGSIAAMLVASKTLSESSAPIRGNLVVSAIVGEEYDNAGTKKMLSDPKFARIADAVIVGEPTSLNLAITHKGFALTEFTVSGRASHGSVPEAGIDAIEKTARIVLAIESLKGEYAAEKHELLGPPKIHTSIIQGGREWSVIPDQCTLRVEARTIPKHEAGEVLRDLNKILDKLASEDPDLKASVKLLYAGKSLETSERDPLVLGLKSAFRSVKGRNPELVGMPYYTEASLFAEALGVPACLMGAGDIRQAHAADEYVSVNEVHELALIYAEASQMFGSATTDLYERH